MSLDKQMKRLSNGDFEAFESIYKKTRRSVYYMALSILMDRTLAEDVMQTTYLKVIRNANLYREGTDVVAWIKRICRNEALNVKKKRGRETYVDTRQNEGYFGTEQTDDYGLLIDLARKTLPQDEFEVLMLVSAVGYKRREVAELMNMPLSTVTYKLNCASGKLIRALQD